ncbi:hypothetical protein GWI33_005370 [Rhynchophorus ferrugineus]|uniref:Peptidase S1 domain-containing protein n=1 Tax=Rhynchophorus ferrugineus TaxID=354439 RepID=A0A834MJM9_RHYFE|nr:hypothetical protein GWI33_005370 [Rhynchophorus ferrugineus]
MKAVFVVVASLALCFAAPDGARTSEDEYVKYLPQLGGRIIGGVVANIADIPYQIAVLRSLAQICGGSIIAARTVLTAAHCVAPSVISSLSQLSVRAGSDRNNTGGSVISASGLVIHESYVDCWYCTPENDIAVVFLSSSALGAGGIASAIPLASSVAAAGTYGVVSGWGATSEGGSGSTQLLRVDVPVFNHVQCRAIYGSYIDTTTVCAGYANGGKDACQGDSGGPYAINGQLVGIVSWGAGCARAGYPGVYASVPGYRTWIRTNAGV